MWQENEFDRSRSPTDYWMKVFNSKEDILQESIFYWFPNRQEGIASWDRLAASTPVFTSGYLSYWQPVISSTSWWGSPPIGWQWPPWGVMMVSQRTTHVPHSLHLVPYLPVLLAIVERLEQLYTRPAFLLGLSTWIEYHRPLSTTQHASSSSNLPYWTSLIK